MSIFLQFLLRFFVEKKRVFFDFPFFSSVFDTVFVAILHGFLFGPARKKRTKNGEKMMISPRQARFRCGGRALFGAAPLRIVLDVGLHERSINC